VGGALAMWVAPFVW